MRWLLVFDYLALYSFLGLDFGRKALVGWVALVRWCGGAVDAKDTRFCSFHNIDLSYMFPTLQKIHLDFMHFIPPKTVSFQSSRSFYKEMR